MRYYTGGPSLCNWQHHFTFVQIAIESFFSCQVKVVTGKDGQAVTPVAIATQLPANVSAAFSVQQQFQVIEATLDLAIYYVVIIFVRQCL